MDPLEDAMELLAPSYATVLRLRAVEAPDDLIAAALGVPEAALPALTSLAESKLRRLLDQVPDLAGQAATAPPQGDEP